MITRHMIMKHMKKFVVIIAAVLAMVGCADGQKNNGPKICAHRGFWNCEETMFSENSIASLRQAQECGLWGSEFDIHLTADSVVVVNHDPVVDGMPIHRTNYSELLSHRLPNGETIPTLDEYLAQGALSGTAAAKKSAGPSNSTAAKKSAGLGKSARKSAPCMLVIELKKQDSREAGIRMAEMTVAALKEHGLYDPDRAMFISFDYNICKWLAVNAPEFQNQYLQGDKSPEEVNADGINGIDYHRGVLRKHPEWVEQAHALGMGVNVWTVNDEEEMRYFIDLGVDVITTNEPLMLSGLLAI